MPDIIQGSPEWIAQRCGKVTASRIADVLAKGKGSAEAETRKNYRAQLVAERLTGDVQESFSNAAMAWGTETEPQARNHYAFYRDAEVIETGMVQHPTIEMAGASPDGLVGDDGLVEFKCPNTATHIDTLLKQKIDNKYIKQMQWQMHCTERDWCDFVSFDPRLPVDMQLFVKRVQKDDEFIAEMHEEVVKFLQDVQATIDDLNNEYSPEPLVMEAG